MQNLFVAEIFGDRALYPVTIYEMSEALKILIDEYRRQCYNPDGQKNLRAIISQVKFFKKTNPKIFKGSKKYLRTKRLKILEMILSLRFYKGLLI